MPASLTPTLVEAVTDFLTNESDQKSSELQPELQKFLRWFGKDRAIGELGPRHIEAYCESSAPGAATRLASLRKFLKHAHEEGLTRSNLAIHVKIKKGSSKAGTARPVTPLATARFTQEGYDWAQEALEGLKQQRGAVAEEIRRAAADKDFRENAPLDAAREKQGHLEGRIRDLEQRLRFAEVVEGAGSQGPDELYRTRLGSRIVVKDMDHDDEVAYTLVDPSEANLRQGRISIESPAGKAFLNRSVGEVVAVQAPVGRLRYRIERIES